MHAVVMVNAAPGFEDSVEASLGRITGVAGITRVKKGNYDLAVLLDVEDASDVQRVLTGELRMLTGVQGIELVEDPPSDLLERLSPGGD